MWLYFRPKRIVRMEVRDFVKCIIIKVKQLQEKRNVQIRVFEEIM